MFKVIASPYLFLFFIFYSFTFGQIPNKNTVYSGFATFYGYGGGGNCSYPDPEDSFTCAMNALQYDTSELCGACIEVTGDSGTIIVTVEDQLPEEKFGNIDINEAVFHLIDAPIKGKVPITWKIVGCPAQDPIHFYFKEGSSKYWTAVQIRNSRYPIKSVEYKVNGEYRMPQRYMYNYFIEQNGFGPGPYDFRITDIYGQILIENDIPLVVTTELPGTRQFPLLKGSSAVKPPQIMQQGKSNAITVKIVKNHELVIQINQQELFHCSLYTANGKKCSEMDLSGKVSAVVPIHTCGLYFLLIQDGMGRTTQMAIPIF